MCVRSRAPGCRDGVCATPASEHPVRHRHETPSPPVGSPDSPSPRDADRPRPRSPPASLIGLSRASSARPRSATHVLCTPRSKQKVGLARRIWQVGCHRFGSVRRVTDVAVTEQEGSSIEPPVALPRPPRIRRESHCAHPAARSREHPAPVHCGRFAICVAVVCGDGDAGSRPAPATNSGRTADRIHEPLQFALSDVSADDGQLFFERGTWSDDRRCVRGGAPHGTALRTSHFGRLRRTAHAIRSAFRCCAPSMPGESISRWRPMVWR